MTETPKFIINIPQRIIQTKFQLKSLSPPL